MADFVIAKKDPLVKRVKIPEVNKVVKSNRIAKGNISTQPNKPAQVNMLAQMNEQDRPKKINHESIKNQPPLRKWFNR